MCLLLLSVTELGVNPYGYLEGESYKTTHFLKNGESYWLRTRNTNNNATNEVATAGNSYAGFYYGIATLYYYILHFFLYLYLLFYIFLHLFY